MKLELRTFGMGVFLTLAVMSCEDKNNGIVPSQNITSEFVDISGYSALEVNDAFEAEINFSETEQPIEIIANENLHPYIEVVKTSS